MEMVAEALVTSVLPATLRLLRAGHVADKSNFRAWRNQALAGPVPDIDSRGQVIKLANGKTKLLSYKDAMTMVYHSWGPDEEAKVERWLAASER